ncbi:transposable element Tcb2 transposase [Trichonephila clavipes]|nr:transposable element Tcb2 transposase [Trichonephila clavipes]
MSQRRRLPNSLRWRAVGWMEMGLSQADAARRLNVSRSVVERLWDQYQSEDSVSRRPVPGRPRATTPAEERFLALLARRRRTTTVPQLVADHFQISGRRISATTVRNRLHNACLYARRPVVCVPLNGRKRRNRLCWAREHVSWTQQQWASVLFTDESRFTMESDSGRLLIWREQRTRYHQSNTVERHSYRGGGILVWAGISLGGHTDLHVFHGGTVTGLRYRDEILDPYVRPYAAAIGNDFILMDDNARPHRARIVEEYLEDHGLERMEWPARSPDLNPIEHLWDYLGREVAALNPPPRSLHELKQSLLCVWSSLRIPVSDNLINSMGNRCRQCIQGRQGAVNVLNSREPSVKAPVFSPVPISGTSEPSENSRVVDVTSCISDVNPDFQILLCTSLIQGQTLSLGKDKPFAIRSELVWIIGGKTNSSGQNSFHVNHIQLVSDQLIDKLWELDSVPCAKPLTSLEEACEDHFVKTHSRDENDRYTVGLPFHTPPTRLGNSKQNAIRRLISMERHLISNPDKYKLYRNFMKEYFDLKHIFFELVLDSEFNKIKSLYLPHHGVVRDTSCTIKLHVVFEVSSKTSGLSLNDLLMVGPRVQPELFPILIQFRIFSVAICADVEKMFRQIKGHEEDLDWQRFLWRDSPTEPIREYRLTTVTYGTSSAPFISTRTLRQLAIDKQENYPAASRATLSHFYVDDLMSGSATKKGAIQLLSELKELTLNVHWNFVSGLENPADCGTRGISPTKLEKCNLWFNGHDWLRSSTFPIGEFEDNPQLQKHMSAEAKRTSKLIMLNVVDATFKAEFFQKFSSWNKLKRVVAYC